MAVTQMTKGSISKQLILFSIPIIISNLFQQLYNTVDTAIVGRFVGANALAAVGTCNLVVVFMIYFFIGLSNGSSIVLSQCFGENDEEKVFKTVHTTMGLSFISGIVLMIVGLLSAETILKMINTPDDVIGYAVTYIRVYFLSMIPMMIYNMGTGILRAMGDSKTPLYYLGAAGILNIILDLVFIIVFNMGVMGAALATTLCLGFIVCYILIKGIPNLTPDLFAWEYNSKNVSMMPAIINTISMTLLSLLFSAPIGIFSAIYLVEYAKRGNKLVGIMRITAETLTGIPSIVYGLFGALFFVSTLKWKLSLMAGACTLAIMVLPVILRTTEEALMSVPDSYREGSFGLGAGKLRTVFKVVLPSAIPGILSGVILAIGRIVGETAALIYTAGAATKVAGGLFESGRTLAVHMYSLSREGLHTDQTYATAVVLLIMVLLINGASGLIAKKFEKASGGEK